jgi:hypothetical protein
MERKYVVNTVRRKVCAKIPFSACVRKSLATWADCSSGRGAEHRVICYLIGQFLCEPLAARPYDGWAARRAMSAAT